MTMTRSSGRFVRDRLPLPIAYLDACGVKLLGRKSWRIAHCCFHEDSTPSLHVNVETGAYKCWGCGARGGNVLDFHIARTGLNFKRAAQSLGAWVER